MTLTLVSSEATPEPADGIFPALLDGLREFRRRVEGTDAGAGALRDKVLELEHIDNGALGKKIAIALLVGLREIITALHQAIAEIHPFLLKADAIVALIEVLGRALSALGDTLEQPWPPPMAFANDAGTALQGVGDVLESAGDIQLPSIIPMPDTLAAILVETRALLGDPDDPHAPTGSLVALIAAVEAPATPD